MTTDQPLDPQGRAYTDGWRDYAMFRIVGNPGQYRKFYMMGWKDNEGRTRLEHERQMALRENTNERRPA